MAATARPISNLTRQRARTDNDIIQNVTGNKNLSSVDLDFIAEQGYVHVYFLKTIQGNMLRELQLQS